MSTAIVPVDQVTGEILADQLTEVEPQGPAVPASSGLNLYSGIAAAAFSEDARALLLADIADDQVELRPDGLVYMPEIRYRKLLNRAFGPGAWAIMPRGIDIGDNMLYYRGALFVNGRFVSEAIGEQQYFPSNDRMSYATAAEAAKSNCLVRCCKDLGIAADLWDPSFVRTWLEKYAVEVWCVSRQDPAKKKKFWRKKAAPPVDVWPWQEEGGRPAKRPEPSRTNEEPTQPRTVPHGGKQSSPPPVSRGEDRTLISPKQAGRFRAISRVHNWRDRELNRLLALHRFGSVEEVTRDAYEGLCAILTDAAKLLDLKRLIEQEDVSGEVLEGLLD
ncbi:MAG: hypothetical protein ABIR47_14625 [Candidatus Kapaibacterium sp.]